MQLREGISTVLLENAQWRKVEQMYKLKAHCQEAAAVLPILLKLFLNSFGQEEVVSREQEEAEEEVVSFSGDTCLFAHRCPSPFFA